MTDDAERDLWLREALRHAPDSGAAAPSAISAAILAEARAAAARPMPASTAGRGAPRAAPTHPWLIFWSWLARPPVAAGFASLMAATLVGLMWWDRPMDETLARPPVAASGRSEAPATAAPAPVDATRPTSEAKDATAVSDARARATDAPATDMQAKNAPARERGAPRRSDAAAAFPAPERGRGSAAAPSAAAEEAKKEAAAGSEFATAPAPFAAAPPARAAASAVVSPPTPPTPLQSGRLASDEAGALASSRADAATPAAAANSIAPPSPAPEPRSDAAPPPAPLPPAAPALRQRSLAEARPNAVDAFASSGARGRVEPAASPRRDGGATGAAPLAPLLAALAGDSTRGSRRSASGSATAVEPAWRDWLADLDAATAGRWQRASDLREETPADADTQGAAALRFALDGRPAATVRLEGATVLVETLGAAPARWQATLAADSAARLRAALARLPP